MQMVARLERLKKPAEAFEPMVGKIITVINIARWRVGDEYVEESSEEDAIEEEPRNQAEDPAPHLPLGKLVLPVVVPDAPPESPDQEPLDTAYRTVYVGGSVALGRCTVGVSQLLRRARATLEAVELL